MAEKQTAPRRSYKRLEQELSIAVLADLALFIVMMVISNAGIGWAKILVGILVMALSALGCVFLVLIGEHKRPRSLWIVTAFGSLLVCALVSLITGSPAP